MQNCHTVNMYKKQIVMPTILQKYIVKWYKTYLLNPIMDHNKTTFSHHYYWPTTRGGIRTHIKVYSTCYNKNKDIKILTFTQ